MEGASGVVAEPNPLADRKVQLRLPALGALKDELPQPCGLCLEVSGQPLNETHEMLRSPLIYPYGLYKYIDVIPFVFLFVFLPVVHPRNPLEMLG
jgi:hypothetical protein